MSTPVPGSARILATLGLVAVTSLSACASGGGSPAPSALPSTSPTASPSATSSPSAAAAAVLLKVTSEGGFIGPTATLAALPTVVVYADGRIFTPAPPSGPNLDPLVPGVDIRDVGPAGAAEILAAIQAAGLDGPAASGDPGVAADTGTTVFAVTVGGAIVTSRFASNGPGGPGMPGGAGDGSPARAAAMDLLGRLLDATETWGAASPAESPYSPTGYRVFAAPAGPPADPAATETPVAWPLDTALGAFGTLAVPDRGIAGLRTGVALGADAARLAAAFATATATTPFTSGGTSWTLYVRPLLPDEAGA